jgi:hypothetical protein
LCLATSTTARIRKWAARERGDAEIVRSTDFVIANEEDIQTTLGIRESRRPFRAWIRAHRT